MPGRINKTKPEVSPEFGRIRIWPPWDPVPDLMTMVEIDPRIKKDLIKLELQKKIQINEIHNSYMKELEKILG